MIYIYIYIIKPSAQNHSTSKSDHMTTLDMTRNAIDSKQFTIVFTIN